MNRLSDEFKDVRHVKAAEEESSSHARAEVSKKTAFVLPDHLSWLDLRIILIENNSWSFKLVSNRLQFAELSVGAKL